MKFATSIFLLFIFSSHVYAEEALNGRGERFGEKLAKFRKCHERKCQSPRDFGEQISCSIECWREVEQNGSILKKGNDQSSYEGRILFAEQKERFEKCHKARCQSPKDFGDQITCSMECWRQVLISRGISKKLNSRLTKSEERFAEQVERFHECYNAKCQSSKDFGEQITCNMICWREVLQERTLVKKGESQSSYEERIRFAEQLEKFRECHNEKCQSPKDFGDKITCSMRCWREVLPDGPVLEKNAEESSYDKRIEFAEQREKFYKCHNANCQSPKDFGEKITCSMRCWREVLANDLTLEKDAGESSYEERIEFAEQKEKFDRCHKARCQSPKNFGEQITCSMLCWREVLPNGRITKKGDGQSSYEDRIKFAEQKEKFDQCHQTKCQSTKNLGEQITCSMLCWREVLPNGRMTKKGGNSISAAEKFGEQVGKFQLCHKENCQSPRNFGEQITCSMQCWREVLPNGPNVEKDAGADLFGDQLERFQLCHKRNCQSPKDFGEKITCSMSCWREVLAA